jgi:hypothetical protein
MKGNAGMAIGKDFGKETEKGNEGVWAGRTHTIKVLYSCEPITLHSFEK